MRHLAIESALRHADDALDAETVVKHADTAMYCAKRGGRNNYPLYTGR